jgi:hypothetical protein
MRPDRRIWGHRASTRGEVVLEVSHPGRQQHHHREGINERLDEAVVLIEALRFLILGVDQKQTYPDRCGNFYRLEDEVLEESGSDSSTLVFLVDSHSGEQQGGQLLGLPLADPLRSG